MSRTMDCELDDRFIDMLAESCLKEARRRRDIKLKIKSVRKCNKKERKAA